MRKGTGFFLIVFMSFLLSGVPLPALDSFELDGGLLFITSRDPDSAPSPLLPAVGVTFPTEGKLWIFDLEYSFLLTGTFYQYANDRASPAEPEYRDYAVPCILADLRGVVPLVRRDSFTLGVDTGVSAFLRFPIPLSSDAAEDFGNTVSYFYLFRFLYPETGFFSRFTAGEDVELKLSLRAYWPLYLLWSPDEPPFPEGLLVSGLISVTLNLPPKES